MKGREDHYVQWAARHSVPRCCRSCLGHCHRILQMLPRKSHSGVVQPKEGPSLTKSGVLAFRQQVPGTPAVSKGIRGGDESQFLSGVI